MGSNKTGSTKHDQHASSESMNRFKCSRSQCFKWLRVKIPLSQAEILNKIHSGQSEIGNQRHVIGRSITGKKKSEHCTVVFWHFKSGQPRMFRAGSSWTNYLIPNYEFQGEASITTGIGSRQKGLAPEFWYKKTSCSLRFPKSMLGHSTICRNFQMKQ